MLGRRKTPPSSSPGGPAEAGPTEEELQNLQMLVDAIDQTGIAGLIVTPTRHRHTGREARMLWVPIESLPFEDTDDGAQLRATLLQHYPDGVPVGILLGDVGDFAEDWE